MPQTKIANRQLPTTLQTRIIDTSNDILTTTSKLKISGGSIGQVLTTDGSGNLSWVSMAGGDIDFGYFYDFGSFVSPANYNLDLGGF